MGGVALLQACAPAAPSAPTAAPAAVSGPAPAAAQPTGAPPASAPAAGAASKPAAAAAGGRVVLPTRIPLEVIKPDLPASADGLIYPGFITYPANPIKTVTDTPGRGGEATVMTSTTLPPPTPLEQNALWQAVNKELGADLKINVVASADYDTKLNTVIAGNELPDMLHITSTAVVAQLPTFLRSKCADLTPYLSGDAIKEYPNLASFPTIAWRQMIYNNAIYGVPLNYPVYTWTHFVHQNLLDDEGLPQPKSADDFRRLAQHFTRPNQNLYGLGGQNNNGLGITNGWLSGIFGAPNNWALDDQTGKLTHFSETEQFRAAVGFARDLWAAGLYHPSTPQFNLTASRNEFAVRRFAFHADGYQTGSVPFWEVGATLTPPAKPRVVTPFAADAGGTPTYWATAGVVGWTMLKQAPPERIKELLRILNYLAAPMGSHEHLLMTYGLKDVHWTPDEKGNPILNDRGKADSTVPFKYIALGPVTLYYSKDPNYAPVMQEGAKAMHQHRVTDPTEGYYSPTRDTKGRSLMRSQLPDGINDVVLGRQPLSHLEEVVRGFMDGGGSAMKAELEQEIAAARG
jgi:putative aldouronate transport system substrate-binding protein